MRKQMSVAVILLLAAACTEGPLPTRPFVQSWQTPSVPARSVPSPGQYLVGIDMEPGRYFSAPAFSGCHYQVDATATYVGAFVPQQWIVDIGPADKTFKTSSDCGTWVKDSPRQGALTTIPPGMWVVGSQIAPGTYSSHAVGECSFFRLRDFRGVASITDKSVIEFGYGFNEPTSVTISADDTGFSTTRECGTWTRESGPG